MCDFMDYVSLSDSIFEVNFLLNFCCYNSCCELTGRNGLSASAGCQNSQPIRSWRRGIPRLDVFHPYNQDLLVDSACRRTWRRLIDAVCFIALSFC